MIKNGLNTIIKNYLYDAGFKVDDFILNENAHNYIEVFFDSVDAVQYIKEDIKKTEYSNFIDILDYRYKDGKISAIITYKEI